MAAEGIVYIVGSGAGVRGLLTLRGAELVASADAVVYDRKEQARLVPSARRRSVNRFFVGSSARRKRPAQADVAQLLVSLARERQRVVYLVAEDPFFLAGISELAEMLHDSSVAFEVVPGVSRASAAAAYSGIPLAAPSLANTTLFVDGTARPGEAPRGTDWAAVARAGGTVVVQNPGGVVDEIVAAFLAAGLPAEMPVAIVRRAGTASQRTNVTTMGNLAAELSGAGTRRPATLVIGWAVVLRDELGWFEERPLFGRRLVVANARHGPLELVSRLRELGATIIEPPAGAMARLDLDAVRELVERPDTAEWLVFDGVESVDIFWETLLAAGSDARSLAGRLIACVGPATAAALLDHGITVDVAPAGFTRGALAELMVERSDVPGAELAYLTHDDAGEFARELENAGATVTEYPLYRIVVPERKRDAFRRALQRRAPDAVIVLSAEGAVRWNDTAGEELASCAPIVARGESAAGALRAAGIEPSLTSEGGDPDAFITVLRDWLQKRR